MSIKANFGKITIDQFFTIPNILCYIRFALIPVFLNVYINATELKDYYIAAGIIFLSGLTDGLDGYIARKYNKITEVGKLIDPLADKFTQLAVLIALMSRIDGMFILTILFVIKEFSMGINGYLLLRKGKKLDGAKWYGKVSTAVFFLVMFIIILFPTLNTNWINVLMIISGFFLLLSFINYSIEFLRMYSK